MTSMFVGELHENRLYADVYIASTVGAAIQVTGLVIFRKLTRTRRSLAFLLYAPECGGSYRL